MAMFQQYQGGIQPVSGMAQAGANIGNMYAQGINNFTKGLAEGIKAYNDNTAKNELANQKIQSLSQDIANKIAMYSQDPEIAQSGVLDGLMQTAATLQDAPTKNLNQRLGLVHEAETRMAGFGNQLQEWSFLRGRAIERGISEALNQYSGKVKSTAAVNLEDPNFSVNPNESIVQQKDRVMKFFGEIKKVNPNVQFNDQEFWQRWLAKAEQTTAKAQDIDPRIISAQLEAINAEKGITAQNRLAEGNLPQGAFTEGGMMYQDKDGVFNYEGTPMQNTVKDYEASMQKPSEAPARQEKQYKQDVADALDFLGVENKSEANAPKVNEGKVATLKQELTAIDNQIAALTAADAEGNRRKTGLVSGAGKAVEKGATKTASWYANRQARNAMEDWFRQSNVDTSKMTDEQLMRFMRKEYRDALSAPVAFLTNLSHPFSLPNPAQVVAFESGAAMKGKRSATFTTREEKAFKMVSENIQSQWEADPSDIKSLQERKRVIEENLQAEGKPKFLMQPSAPAPVQPKVAPINVGELVVGTVDKERRLSVSERKSQVQDFLTQRFGAVDPTDPNGKRKVPVQGFEQFFQKAVPESEIQEYETESGIRLVRMNGKWEQMKMPEARTLQDIRKESVGVYGQQTRDGRLVPTEFLPNSGIMIGGLFKGTDAAESKFSDEMTQLVDARRSIRRLQEINDKTGEFASFKLSGEAAVEVMNLKAALRTDIIGVGTVSNFEQALIDKVIKDPTEFFSMESRDRAILLALANRIDRRIRNYGAAKGLTVQIRDTDSESGRYEALRQKYLKEKYGI
jgi:hypothetical protein